MRWLEFEAFQEAKVRKSPTAIIAIIGSIMAVTSLAQGSYTFYPVTPCRVVDTRQANPQQPGTLATAATPVPPLWPPPAGQPGWQAGWTGPTDETVPSNYKIRNASQFDGTGDCGIPPTARAVVLNMTVVQPGSNGNLKVWGFGDTLSLTSFINFVKDERPIVNEVIVALPVYNPANPDISVRNTTGMIPKQGGAHLVIDVRGYFQ